MPSARAKAAQRSLSSMLSRVKAANARLDAECASELSSSDLGAANLVLDPIFELCPSLVSRKSMDLDEALVYLHEPGVCELLVSLLRRMPWTQLRSSSAVMVSGLALLPALLFSLSTFLQSAKRVAPSQQAAAYVEMSKRCLLEARLRALGCAEKLHSQELVTFPCSLLVRATNLLCSSVPGMRACSCTR